MRKEDFYARTMHTPDDPERARQREALRELWKHLLPLHRLLIDAARDEYTSSIGPVGGPTRLLQLLSDDPFFAWLKPMTALIVEIDEMSRTDFDKPRLEDVVRRVRAVFAVDGDSAFGARYLPLLQRDVDAAIAHAAVRQSMARLAT